MTFEEVVDQALAMLQRRSRVTYRLLQRHFQLDDAALEDLKEELIYGQRVAVDEEERVLVWSGETAAAPSASVRVPAPDGSQARAPLSYTPPHLADKIRTTRATLEGERKHVTVLFADLKDSTELIRGLDPEAAQQLLDPAIHHMMDAVHRYKGTVNQVLGDGIMALFGAPIAHEDHALRACYAALAMQGAMQPYTQEVRRSRGLELRMRVGLNAGEVVVRAISNDLHMDYSAVGETTVLAARMEQTATPGTTRLTAATLHLVEGLVEVTPLGPVPVKGLEEPVEVFELVGASGIRRRLQAAAMRGLTPFVGRQPELVALHQALARVQTGHGHVVALVGEAGVGKSRLVYECVHSRRTQGWRVLESAAVSYGKTTPYFPVIDLLKRYVQGEDADDPRTWRTRVTGQVLTLDEALQDTLPPLLALLDALPEDSPFRQLEPTQRRQHTLTALKRLLLRESQEQPLLLVCEDLHWIDAETQALLDSLVESLPTARLLLLVNYRPEYQHGWGSKTYYTQLRLDPLPPVSADEFLHAFLGDDPSLVPFKPRLIARTEGNPFFLEESVRTLVETGVLVGAPGAYRLSRPLEGLQVPATVHAVLAARIDRLPPEEKRLLQTAAVLGMDVSYTLLRAMVDVPEAALHRALAAGERALALAVELGERALQVFASYTLGQACQAIGDFGRAAELLRWSVEAADRDAGTPGTDMQILSRAWLALPLSALGAFTEGRRHGQEALRLAMLAGRGITPSVAHGCLGLLYLGYVAVLQGRLAEGRTLLEEAISEGLRTGALLNQARRVAQLSEVCRLAGHGAEAGQHARQALDLARQHKERGNEALALHQLGVVHAHADPPDVAPAEASYQQALALANELGMRPLVAHCHLGLGKLYVTSGRHAEARAALPTAVELYRAMEMTFWLPQAEAALAQVEER